MHVWSKAFLKCAKIMLCLNFYFWWSAKEEDRVMPLKKIPMFYFIFIYFFIIPVLTKFTCIYTSIVLIAHQDILSAEVRACCEVRAPVGFVKRYTWHFFVFQKVHARVKSFLKISKDKNVPKVLKRSRKVQKSEKRKWIYSPTFWDSV